MWLGMTLETIGRSRGRKSSRAAAAILRGLLARPDVQQWSKPDLTYLRLVLAFALYVGESSRSPFRTSSSSRRRTCRRTPPGLEASRSRRRGKRARSPEGVKTRNRRGDSIRSGPRAMSTRGPPSDSARGAHSTRSRCQCRGKPMTSPPPKQIRSSVRVAAVIGDGWMMTVRNG